MKLGFYLFAEYINMFISSVIMATLYFGGYDIPFVNECQLSVNIAALVGIVALLIKVVIFIFIFMWVRWTIPRFQIRPVNESWLESIDSTCFVKYVYNRCSYFVEAMIDYVRINYENEIESCHCLYSNDQINYCDFR